MRNLKIEKGAISASFRISSRGVRKVVYDGLDLTKLRERTGLSQAEFAALCGWSQQHQAALELPWKREITLDKLNAINQAAEKILVRQA